MKKYLDKYYYCFFMGFQNSMEYRVDFLFSLISCIFPIIIQVSLWSAIYKATGTGIVYGYSYKQMIMYTLLVGLVGKFLSTGFEWEINDDIKMGGLSKYIVRPINYIYYRLSCFLGGRISLSVVVIFFMTSIMIAFPNEEKLTLLRIVWIITTFMLAMLLNFFIYFILGISAFYFTEVAKIFPAVSIIFTVISGGIFPLDILGEGYMEFLNVLPFKYMLQFPVDVLIGKISNEGILFGITIQLIWAVIIFVFLKVLFNKGLKKYIAIGG
ncbi:MAG: ABC transporter permease [Clostridium sp.]|uniref:ABC transporter permease n=1 Tax=Clostridium sp. TaxID=1506 RepID=UPI003EE7EC17